MLLDGHLCTPMQVARASVVAEAAPEGEHVLDRRRRERRYRGKSLQEALVVAEHGRHLRLLQHDFREPDTIGVTGLLPGQPAAAMAALPRDDARGEGQGVPCGRRLAGDEREFALG